MNTSGADQLIVTSLAVTGALSVVHEATIGGRPDVVRVLIGVFVAGTMLTVLAEFAPELAGSLATLVLIAALVFGGPDVFNAIAKRTGNINVPPPGETATPEFHVGNRILK